MNTMQLESAVRQFTEKTGIRVENECVRENWDNGIPLYTIYLETDRNLPPDAAVIMDQCLCESSFGYRDVRMMNELACAQVFRVRKETFGEYQHYRQAKGMRMEQSKLIRVLTRDFRSSQREGLTAAASASARKQRISRVICRIARVKIKIVITTKNS